MAINSRPRNGRGRCMRLGLCFQGCKRSAKWSSLYTEVLYTEIPKAEATGKLGLQPDSHVVRIEHGDKGKVNAVVYVGKAGQQQREKARIVCVAGNSIETPRLLLSASSMFKDGLAGSSSQVGRNGPQRHAPPRLHPGTQDERSCQAAGAIRTIRTPPHPSTLNWGTERQGDGDH
jgi:choline dehydrogenase-like flavoprotein